MDDSKGLTDIERALAEALAVDVSPDFAARVRQRIASEPRRHPFWYGWRIAVPLALATAVVAAVGLALFSKSTASAPQRLAVNPVAIEPGQPVAIPPTRPVTAVERVVPSNRARAASVFVAAAKEPEVLVPREEIEMYRRLFAAAQRVPDAVVVEAPKDIVLFRIMSEITIDPIRIDLVMPPPAGGEGDRQ